MATTINAGRVRFVSRGTYNNSTQYYLFDLVDYNGSSYIAKENTLGNLPTNTQYWQLIAEKGNTGSTGQTGPVGATGNGIASITKTGTDGLVDTYTITYTNGNTTTFTITNGEDGEVTETELNVLREKLANQQKVIDQLPQVEGQGTEVTLENTIEAPFTKFDVEGNSVQDGTPSPDNEVPILSSGDNENLFDGETITFNAYDNIETAKDGLVTTKALSNTGTSNVNIRFPALNLSPDTYYISMDIRIKSGTGDFVKLNDGATDWSVVSKPTISSSFQRYVYKHTYTAEKALNQILVQFSNNSNTVYEIERIMVGNKASGYSPYGMGSINEKISNKNVLDYKEIFNNAEDYSSAFKIYQKKLQPNTSYTTSSNFPYTNNETGFIVVNSTDEPSTVNYGLRGEITTTTNSDGIIRIYIRKFSEQQIIPKLENFESGTYYIQIEPGTQKSSYVEHKEQDYSIFVQQPFRSIGDVRDCFVKKSDGWYERHAIEEIILNGTETITIHSSSETRTVFRVQTNASNFNVIKQTGESCRCSHFIPVWQGASWVYGNISTRAGEYKNLYITMEANMTVEEFQSWLSINNVIVNMILAEPQDLPCTEEQIQQLENLPSTYKDFTYVVSEDETPAYLEVSGIYDLNKLINN